MQFLRIIGFLSIIGFGLLQLSATIAGLEYWFGGHAIIASVIGLLFGYMPFIGGITGVIGAVKVWHWSWLGAILLFWGIPLAVIIIAVVCGGFEVIKSNILKRKK